MNCGSVHHLSPNINILLGRSPAVSLEMSYMMLNLQTSPWQAWRRPCIDGSGTPTTISQKYNLIIWESLLQVAFIQTNQRNKINPHGKQGCNCPRDLIGTSYCVVPWAEPCSGRRGGGICWRQLQQKSRAAATMEEAISDPRSTGDTPCCSPMLLSSSLLPINRPGH